ncbi:unnamed protein product [Amoebophrya sp. A120]|nr:unnamed protein product [Amoebophrya sp. A120]|eukprot:GSA120T00010008001.1
MEMCEGERNATTGELSDKKKLLLATSAAAARACLNGSTSSWSTTSGSSCCSEEVDQNPAEDKANATSPPVSIQIPAVKQRVDTTERLSQWVVRFLFREQSNSNTACWETLHRELRLAAEQERDNFALMAAAAGASDVHGSSARSSAVDFNNDEQTDIDNTNTPLLDFHFPSPRNLRTEAEEFRFPQFGAGAGSSNRKLIDLHSAREEAGDNAHIHQHNNLAPLHIRLPPPGLEVDQGARGAGMLLPSRPKNSALLIPTEFLSPPAVRGQEVDELLVEPGTLEAMFVEHRLSYEDENHDSVYLLTLEREDAEEEAENVDAFDRRTARRADRRTARRDHAGWVQPPPTPGPDQLRFPDLDFDAWLARNLPAKGKGKAKALDHLTEDKSISFDAGRVNMVDPQHQDVDPVEVGSSRPPADASTFFPAFSDLRTLFREGGMFHELRNIRNLVFGLPFAPAGHDENERFEAYITAQDRKDLLSTTSSSTYIDQQYLNELVDDFEEQVIPTLSGMVLGREPLVCHLIQEYLTKTNSHQRLALELLGNFLDFVLKINVAGTSSTEILARENKKHLLRTKKLCPTKLPVQAGKPLLTVFETVLASQPHGGEDQSAWSRVPKRLLLLKLLEDKLFEDEDHLVDHPKEGEVMLKSTGRAAARPARGTASTSSTRRTARRSCSRNKEGRRSSKISSKQGRRNDRSHSTSSSRKSACSSTGGRSSRSSSADDARQTTGKNQTTVSTTTPSGFIAAVSPKTSHLADKMKVSLLQNSTVEQTSPGTTIRGLPARMISSPWASTTLDLNQPAIWFAKAWRGIRLFPKLEPTSDYFMPVREARGGKKSKTSSTERAAQEGFLSQVDYFTELSTNVFQRLLDSSPDAKKLFETRGTELVAEGLMDMFRPRGGRGRLHLEDDSQNLHQPVFYFAHIFFLNVLFADLYPILGHGPDPALYSVVHKRSSQDVIPGGICADLRQREHFCDGDRAEMLAGDCFESFASDVARPLPQFPMEIDVNPQVESVAQMMKKLHLKVKVEKEKKENDKHSSSSPSAGAGASASSSSDRTRTTCSGTGTGSGFAAATSSRNKMGSCGGVSSSSSSSPLCGISPTKKSTERGNTARSAFFSLATTVAPAEDERPLEILAEDEKMEDVEALANDEIDGMLENQEESSASDSEKMNYEEPERSDEEDIEEEPFDDMLDLGPEHPFWNQGRPLPEDERMNADVDRWRAPIFRLPFHLPPGGAVSNRTTPGKMCDQLYFSLSDANLDPRAGASSTLQHVLYHPTSGMPVPVEEADLENSQNPLPPPYHHPYTGIDNSSTLLNAAENMLKRAEVLLPYAFQWELLFRSIPDVVRDHQPWGRRNASGKEVAEDVQASGKLLKLLVETAARVAKAEEEKKRGARSSKKFGGSSSRRGTSSSSSQEHHDDDEDNVQHLKNHNQIKYYVSSFLHELSVAVRETRDETNLLWRICVAPRLQLDRGSGKESGKALQAHLPEHVPRRLQLRLDMLNFIERHVLQDRGIAAVLMDGHYTDSSDGEVVATFAGTI